MSVQQEDLDIERLKNLVEAFDWELKKVERLDDQIVVTLSKPRDEDIDAEAVGAD